MKKDKMVSKELQIEIITESDKYHDEAFIKEDSDESDSSEHRYAKPGKYPKVLLYLVLFVGLATVTLSCVGYVESEPSYMEYDRPLAPGEGYIWIDGGWRWDIRTHTYVQRHGYWQAPRTGRSFVEGHWQSTPRGKTWEKGHWQRQGGERRENQDRRKDQ